MDDSCQVPDGKSKPALLVLYLARLLMPLHIILSFHTPIEAQPQPHISKTPRKAKRPFQNHLWFLAEQLAGYVPYVLSTRADHIQTQKDDENAIVSAETHHIM